MQDSAFKTRREARSWAKIVTSSTAEHISVLISDPEAGFEEVGPDWYPEVDPGLRMRPFSPGRKNRLYGEVKLKSPRSHQVADKPTIRPSVNFRVGDQPPTAGTMILQSHKNPRI
jgi:hypothetical protein